MKNANRTRFIPRFVLALALTGACIGWIPQEKGKRKMRMADAAPVAAQAIAGLV